MAAKKPAKPKAPKPKKGSRAQPPKSGRGSQNGHVGRPSIFSDELVAKICETIEKTGVRAQVAAAEHGVSPTTFDRWQSEARAGKSAALVEFGEKVARARLIAEGKLHRDVLAGDEPGVGFGPSKAALEVLSRTNKHYSAKVAVAVEGELHRLIDAIRGVLDAESFARCMAAIEATEQESADEA